MEIGLEYILDNKKPRVYPVDNFMYFLIKDKKVVYIGFGNSIDSVMQENKDYDSYCTIKDNFKDKERMKVLIDNLKLYKPKYNNKNFMYQCGNWGLKCEGDNFEEFEIFPTFFINGQPVED